MRRLVGVDRVVLLAVGGRHAEAGLTSLRHGPFACAWGRTIALGCGSERLWDRAGPLFFPRQICPHDGRAERLWDIELLRANAGSSAERSRQKFCHNADVGNPAMDVSGSRWRQRRHSVISRQSFNWRERRHAYHQIWSAPAIACLGYETGELRPAVHFCPRFRAGDEACDEPLVLVRCCLTALVVLGLQD